MIKNGKQASLTKKRLNELEGARIELELNKQNYDDANYSLAFNSLCSLIDSLKSELGTYEEIIKGNLGSFQISSLIDVPNALVAGRLAQNLSQNDLGMLLGVQEQQIQRYEASDYETASWVRIVEAATALKLKFVIQRISIGAENYQVSRLFDLPTGVNVNKVLSLTESLKERGNRLCCLT